MNVKRWYWGLVLAAVLVGCTGVPEGVNTVDAFNLDRYLGRWYEIARLDHPFERGLERVTAQYSRREDGGLKVINRGYDPDADEWKTAEGKAYPIENTTGRFKVSFFGPFYSAYNIIALDDDYRYAMVSGPDRDYLWILSRTPALSPDVRTRLLDKARSLGYAVDKLIYPRHSGE